MTRKSYKALSIFVMFAALALQACHGGYHYGGGWGHHPGYGGGWGHGPGHGHGGGWGHGPGHGHGGGWGGHRLMGADEIKGMDLQVADAGVAEAQPADSAALLANDYAIKYESAQQFIQLAEDKNLSQVSEKMGVSLTELAPLSKLEMPAAETIDKISANLTEDRAKVEALLSDFIADIKAEDAAKN